jgi:hypothetical protein
MMLASLQFSQSCEDVMVPFPRLPQSTLATTVKPPLSRFFFGWG